MKMELEGQIEDFIYQNDNNNYSIAVFLTNDQLTSPKSSKSTVPVGTLAFITLTVTLSPME